MIIGLIARNYKCYKGINFIPFVKDDPEYLRLIIGNNGVGKSALLEAMDSYFNDAPWIVHTDSPKKNDAAVGILFLMEKEKAKSIIGLGNEEILSNISDTFWSLNVSQNSNYGKYYSDFFNLRDNLLPTYKGTHYLFMLGKDMDKKDVTFLTFHTTVFDNLKTLVNQQSILYNVGLVAYNIQNHYSYLYIPVESSVSEFLKLEARGMQILMDKTIKDTIATTFNEKRVTRNGGKKKFAYLDIINKSLESYVSSVEEQIQKIDPDYNFKKGYRQNTNLTANHITDVIIESYYSKRKLKKGDKPISTLSSGEKRRALIDIIYAFIIQSNNMEKELILSIDEPESSLHISKCYEQFERIQDISVNHQKTVFVATHWYGSLPILKSGTLMHIDDDSKSTIFSLSNYFEERREHPDDIQFKSFFDLSSSILSSLRSANYNWLLVEGKEDKQYIEYYIDASALNLKILPLGGCGNVKKIYEYLFVPISSTKKSEEVNGKKQKVFCLIDTDLACVAINVDSETKNHLLQIRRLQEKNDHSIGLFKVNDPTQSATEIEETLNPEIFYKALSVAIEQCGNDEEKTSFLAFNFDDGVNNSKIIGDYSILSHNGQGRSLREDKERIKWFIDNNKPLIASEYSKIPRIGDIPAWIQEIECFFTNQTPSK
ncbi:MAG: ATP-binding protein [Candidatus Symbiothrix sp.]|jgi:energy-coupling factor transporter ATP-binding protein EcfA2|nr:ATP-binding protein [Candidatus Symbiothrix sp.]